MTFWGLLRNAGDDQVMRTTQDQFFDRVYWSPSERDANALGISTALGSAVVYDSHIHGSWTRMRDRTTSRFGAATTLGERTWVARYVDVRREWLGGHSNSLLRRTVYRMDAFRQLIADGNWDLRLPFRVRSLTVSEASLGAPQTSPSGSGAPTPTPAPAPSNEPRLLHLRIPLLQGDDVRTLQQALVRAGISITIDGVFGSGMDQAVKQFQEQHDLTVDGIVGSATRIALESGETPIRASAEEGTSPTPEPEQRISVWISERTQSPNEPLLVGHAYTLNCKVGSPIASSLITGADAHVLPAEVPEHGLGTTWVVTSRDVELGALSPEVIIKTRNLGKNAQSWMAQFDLHIPKDGESAVRQLRITPLNARIATLDINVFSRGELFRQFLVELFVASVGANDKSNGTPTVAIKDDTIITLPGELGLRPKNEWQRPPGKLQIIAQGDDRAYVQGSIFRDGAWLDISESIEWHTPQTELNGLILNVRRAAEHFREDFESYLNDIEPADLAARLSNFHPVYTWDEAHDRADSQTDRAHTEAWEKQVRQSDRLRDLAAEGYALYKRLFPAGSDLRPWLDGLLPGYLLDIHWTQKDRPGVSSIPWSLVYMADPDDPIDPLRFMGLRFRLSYWAHPMSPTSQALGDPATTYRAHLLYWGSGETDAASVEARWQRGLWAELAPQVVAGPVDMAPKSALLRVIRAPEPVPMTVLYLFCHCDVGEGNEVVLRFGGTKDGEDIIRQTELPNRPFEQGPLVFANACTTAASDPTIANELETRFFERGCRAFIGTETKVPIRFASRFAAIFFHFFYRRASETPVAAGEAMAQTRLFLWTHYKNIGGLLYSYINRYDLLLASNEELKVLRVP